MSCCDDMRVVITNQAIGPDPASPGVTAKIVGIRDTGPSTLRGLSTGQTIEFNRTVTGNAFSGSGSEGEAYGTITVELSWEGALEIIDLVYNGTPKNSLGWCPCATNGTPSDSSHYRATVTSQTGEHQDSSVSFLIQNKNV